MALIFGSVVAAPLAYGKEYRKRCSRPTLRTVERFKTGAILLRRVPKGSARIEQVYGCLFTTNRFVPLGSRKSNESVSGGSGRSPVIVGRYVAYVQKFGEKTPTSVIGLNVVDLKLRRLAAARDYGNGGAWSVGRFVLKASGGVAWVGNEAPRIGTLIHKIDGPAVGPLRTDVVELEASPYILSPSDPMLSLTDNRSTLRWALVNVTTGAQTIKTAPLY